MQNVRAIDVGYGKSITSPVEVLNAAQLNPPGSEGVDHAFGADVGERVKAICLRHHHGVQTGF
jgi:hypothetical protein